MLSDPARIDAEIRAHWPRQLRFLLERQPARPPDRTLVRRNPRQFGTDSLFLPGGTGNLANATVVPELKFRPERWTPGQMGGYLRTAQAVIPISHRLRFLAMIFQTRNWNCTVSGVVEESSDDRIDILRQMHDTETQYVRETRNIDYGKLSCEPLSCAMLGMMGLAALQPWPWNQLAWIRRDDVVPPDAGIRPGKHLVSFTLATSGLQENE